MWMRAAPIVAFDAAALEVDQQVARGGGGHAGHFTEVQVSRQLQKVARGIERELLLLGER